MSKIQKDPFPSGHFYSPTIDQAEVTDNQESIWPSNPTILGIDFRDSSQVKLLKTDFLKYYQDFDYPETEEELTNPWDFNLKNGQFGYWDSQILYTILRARKPKRMIEIGSGFSSLLTADVNRNFLNSKLDFKCIEPFPRPFLLEGVPGITDLIVSKVQDVPLSTFDELKSGDILFIDSSHVSKTGSDVNYIYFNILPRLNKGVIIHIHDIFFPQDYKKKWVLEEHRSWNEQYILQAMLMYSSGFKVLLGANYTVVKWANLVKPLQKGKVIGGGSFWIEKTAGSDKKPTTSGLSSLKSLVKPSPSL